MAEFQQVPKPKRKDSFAVNPIAIQAKISRWIVVAVGGINALLIIGVIICIIVDSKQSDKLISLTQTVVIASITLFGGLVAGKALKESSE